MTALFGPARGFAAADAVAALEAIWFLKRAVAHVLAGWIVKAPRLEDKLVLAEHQARDLEQAGQVWSRLRALSRLSGEPRVSERWRAALAAVDAQPSLEPVIDAIYRVVRPSVLERCRALAAATDPVLDASTCRLLAQIVADEESAAAWAARRSVPAADWRALVEALAAPRGEGGVTVENALWRPVDRVTQARRESQLTRGTPGSLRSVPANPVDDPRDVAQFLHSSICEEYTTLELIARNSYEHPELPPQFHADLARQAVDEARHALAISDALRALGVEYGELPVYTISYDALYQFDECEPGSRRELLWRILLRQTFHEGMALDSLAREMRQRSAARQTRLAEMFSFILADELLHVESGLRWSRRLCGDDARAAMAERSVAHDAFIAGLKRRRAEFVRRDPDAALAELALLDEREQRLAALGPMKKELNRPARQAAGFLDEEIQQVIAWGYYPSDA